MHVSVIHVFDGEGDVWLLLLAVFSLVVLISVTLPQIYMDNMKHSYWKWKSWYHCRKSTAVI